MHKKPHCFPGKLRELKFDIIPPLSEPALPLHRQQLQIIKCTICEYPWDISGNEGYLRDEPTPNQYRQKEYKIQQDF